MSELSDCERDLKNLRRYADEVERTLVNVKAQATEKTWRGPGGDKLRKDFEQRSKEIRASLRRAKEEMERIRKKLETEEAQKKDGD
ncbi:hypothetical protein [Streptomyces buecherae]|uniref:Uncharacterized protein n=1 Tax=Streptomyces buecherae TaxID=2763006 RepID=A0A7H8N7P2_9ACTN|nr:hypothetical protein [Streptomyces buecherae]QKW50422.1 hypothetical protein HUT08_13765 [Streptomyces buecherae]